MTSEQNSLPVCPLRLHDITGFDNRANDVVYCPSSTSNSSSKVVVFFPGDVQDYIENMVSHRDNKNYKQWNLESTAYLLHSAFFGSSNILVVRPSRMEYKTFSCYHNFVSSNKCGAPDHNELYNALNHLELLLGNVAKKVECLGDTELRNLQETSMTVLTENDSLNVKNDLVLLEPSKIKDAVLNLVNTEINLIGFSKGCVVLNQFLYEFNYYSKKTSEITIPKIIPQIKDMYWLDGGHNGGKNTWITSVPLLESLVQLGIQVHIDVTPYQIQDDRRPWIRKEEKCFYETLVKLGANVDRTVHFKDVTANLLVHFDVLKHFKNKS